MTGVAKDIQGAPTLQLQLPFAVYAGFLWAVAPIHQCVDSVFFGTKLDAFLVGDVDGWSAGVFQRYTSQRHRTPVAACKSQRAIGCLATELIGYLVVINSICVELVYHNMCITY